MNLTLDHLHGLFESGLQLLLELVFRPERERSFDAALVDVFRHEPADRFEQPVAGGAPRRRVVVLLDEHGGKPAGATEVLDDSFDDFGTVRDVRSAGFDL